MRNRPQILVDRPQVVVGHVLKRGPGHHLEETAALGGGGVVAGADHGLEFGQGQTGGGGGGRPRGGGSGSWPVRITVLNSARVRPAGRPCSSGVMLAEVKGPNCWPPAR